jgi:hypothetical protein
VSIQLALFRAMVDQGNLVPESNWGLDRVPETALGGAPLRRLTADAVQRSALFRALYVNATNVTLHRSLETADLGGPHHGMTVGAALAEWRMQLLEPLLASGSCSLDVQAGQVSASLSMRCFAKS